MNGPGVRIRSWIAAGQADSASGLLGYLTIFYGDLVLDGVVLRRTADGRFALAFPARTDRAGHRQRGVWLGADDPA